MKMFLRTALLFCVGVACPAFAQIAPSTAPECTEAKAIDIARTQPTVAQFCAAPVNGKSNGCDFKARKPSPLNASESGNPDLGWIVTASVIHSFDAAGKPLSMPEGFMFTSVSKECKIIIVLDNVGTKKPVGK